MTDQKAFGDPLSGLAFAREDEVMHNQQTLVCHFSWLCATGVVTHAGTRRRNTFRRPSTTGSQYPGRDIRVDLTLQSTLL